MKSPVVKRSIVVAGHKTSVSLEEAFWNGMKEISGLRDMTLSELVGEIDFNRQQGNLSSAIRLFVLDYFRTRAMAPPRDRIRSRRRLAFAERRDALQDPEHCHAADRIGRRQFDPARPHHARTGQQQCRDRECRDEQKLSDFDADIEEQ